MEVRYVNERVVSEMTAFSVQTLRNDRHCGKGIPYVKKGRSVRYDIRDVAAFMENHKVSTEK
jgi:hypothetical protein